MTDRALKLPRLSFSLSLTGAMLSLCFFFFFLFARTQKKKNAMKKKKKASSQPENGFLSIH